MSRVLLDTLLNANAFLPSALSDDLLACHVPFDELLDSAGVENELEACTRRGVATALIGHSGSGKSAVFAWVYDRINSDFAPIRAPVFYEAESTIAEPRDFARYVLLRLLGDARSVDSLTRKDRESLLQLVNERQAMPTRTIGHTAKGTVGLPWLLKAEAAREVAMTLSGAEYATATEDVLQAIDKVIDAITKQGLTPILVLDDTDRWLQVGTVDRRYLVGRFFGTIVRMLAERGCGLAVAVHESYLDFEEYQIGTRGFLTDSIHIPALQNPESLRNIVLHRIRIQESNACLDDAFEASALERLFDYYESAGNRSLRWTLQVLHSSLCSAARDGAELIGSTTIDYAAAA